MHSFAPFSNLNFFVKNRQFYFAIELMNFINSIANNSNLDSLFSENFMPCKARGAKHRGGAKQGVQRKGGVQSKRCKERGGVQSNACKRQGTAAN